MSNSFLAFQVDAPMQSWGVASRYQHRESESFPSKSGITGILAAALGIDKHGPNEDAAIAPLAELKMIVLHAPKLPNRAAQRLSDFHTVGGGWGDDWKADKNDLRAKMHTPKKAGDSSPFGTVITHRTYLTDTRFIVLLEGGTSLLEQCAAALENPKWGVWFGRKCCIPAAPLLPTLAPSQDEVLQKISTLLGLDQTMVAIKEGRCEATLDGAWYQQDKPVSFGRREFLSRPVSRILPSTENQTP
jgi:CRISPR system Cascade subunit CasD